MPLKDIYGREVDFTHGARLKGARNLALTGRGACDAGPLKAAHLGVLQSPQTKAAVVEFLSGRGGSDD